jgi:hypothetical protein
MTGVTRSSYWRDRRQSSKNLSYFGTGETFLFTLSPQKKKYEWVGLHEDEIPNTAHMFLAGDNSVLTIGGGYVLPNICKISKCIQNIKYIK